MPVKARLYLASVITAGCLLLLVSVFWWNCTDSARYLIYVVLAIFGSACKVRIPGITGTYSLNFVFILLAVVSLSPGECVVLACVCAVVQSLWKAAVRPSLAQVVFNASNVAISAAVSQRIAMTVIGTGSSKALPVAVAIAAGVYFLINTLLVSVILTLLDGRPFFNIWSRWFSWSLPYYLLGAAIAGLIIVSGARIGWNFALFAFPVTYLVYCCYRLYIAPGTRP